MSAPDVIYEVTQKLIADAREEGRQQGLREGSAYAMDVRRALEDCCTRMERCKGILRADRSAPQGWNVLDTTNARAALAKNHSEVAQLVEPLAVNQVVAGSSPALGATDTPLTVACRWRSWCDEGKWLPPEKQCDECPRLHSHSSCNDGGTK